MTKTHAKASLSPELTALYSDPSQRAVHKTFLKVLRAHKIPGAENIAETVLREIEQEVIRTVNYFCDPAVLSHDEAR